MGIPVRKFEPQEESNPRRTGSSTYSVRLVCTVVLAYCALLNSNSSADDAPIDFMKDVRPILLSRCGDCHGEDTQEASLRFDQLSIDIVNDRRAAHSWREALHQINAGEMPPEDETPLTSAERETVTGWISSTLRRAIAEQRSSGGRIVMRRLNNAEYQNTMSDLLGLDMNYTRDLPPDAVSPDGYTNNGQSLRISAIQLEYYLDTARRALERVIVSGPPPKVFRHRFEQSNVGGWRGPTEKSNRLERAQKFLAKMVNDYPESGEFRVRVQTRAELRPQKGFPLLECSVGYRPDTEVHFKVAGVEEIYSENSQQTEFSGRLENFPLPVRGQGKYPGLVVRLRNVYSDGTEMPKKLEKFKRNGKEVSAFRPEPDLPALLIDSVEFEGPVYSQWPPALHRRILFESELRDQNEVAYVREVLTRFMTRAFRRPVSRFETEEMFAHFASIRPHFIRFEDAIRETLAMVLIQPDFLFVMEPDSQQKRRIGDWELASRLSYFLWSTMPDGRLFELAEANLLREPAVLRSEVLRMLADERSERFAQRFVTQWLSLHTIDYTSIDRERYPQFDESLKPLMQQETIKLFSHLLQTDETALRLLDASFTLLNEPLARHYGIEGVQGRRFQRVALPATMKRGGLLGHAGILLANSSGRDSHPIRRAVWIRERLLHDPPAPPPPDVPELDEADPEFAKLSIREQLEIHRDRESCASCHRDIDPWGIALENFDAIGKWRDTVSKRVGEQTEIRPVVARDTLPDGTVFDGPDSLRRYLVSHRKDDFARALVRNLLTYSLGRTLELSDEEEVDDLAKQFAEDGFRLRPLVLKIVSSSPFQTK